MRTWSLGVCNYGHPWRKLGCKQETPLGRCRPAASEFDGRFRVDCHNCGAPRCVQRQRMSSRRTKLWSPLTGDPRCFRTRAPCSPSYGTANLIFSCHSLVSYTYESNFVLITKLRYSTFLTIIQLLLIVIQFNTKKNKIEKKQF